MEKIIEVKNVTFEYDDSEQVKTVIKDFNLDIERGSFTVILGHNGSGKSTLAKLLNGLYKPASGKVLVDGIDTADESTEIEVKRRVGMVFQNPDNQLIASIVEEDVAFGPENLGLEPDVIRQRVDDALKAVGMYEFRRSTPHHLSGGQKQRIAIAGIIAMEPECIVLDEPTAMLDPKGRAEIIDTILKLNREKNITVVLITHFMEEAELADRILVMSNGKILADSTPKTVFSDVSLLKSVGLDVPQTTELLYALKSGGADIETDVLSIEETADAIAKAFHLEEI
ncbi:MAG: energy-coupling factor transporter ATPase [Ruminococcaceae bacterium]|nr:energy-coupling factor transporter ATPase [Oscillospiraceae bacterium]